MTSSNDPYWGGQRFNTGTRTRVPKPAAQCRKKKYSEKVQTDTHHTCKLLADHEGLEHECICEISWTEKPEEVST